jgi:hypothetical protein
VLLSGRSDGVGYLEQGVGHRGEADADGGGLVLVAFA